jgi:hypothetical protein
LAEEILLLKEEAVQSCITSITFPDNVDDYEIGLLRTEETYGAKKNDIESLLNFYKNENISWTAPKWLTSGDIMFFYLTKSFKIKTSKLLQVAPRRLHVYIKTADHLADIYSGTIFACADILDSSFYGEAIYPHCKSKVFAPLKSVTVFQNPIPLEDFNDIIKIRKGAITPLFGEAFSVLVNAIGSKNSLPKTLQNKKSEKGFYGINKTNWIDVSCNESKRFLNEHQLREFFIDYFIEYLKDDGSNILNECDCFRKDSPTGTVDYFIKINKNWVPIEAKLNGCAEKDLFKQINKYIHIDYFNNGKKRIASPKMPICLLIDQSGLYITHDGRFIECDYDQPYLKREEITMDKLIKIKKSLSSIIQESIDLQA